MDDDHSAWLLQIYRMADQGTQETAARMLSRLDGYTIDTKTNEHGCSLLIVDCDHTIRALDLYAFVMTVDPQAELIQSVHGPEMAPSRNGCVLHESGVDKHVADSSV